MDEKKYLKLAIVSDLHCHPLDVSKKESYMVAGAPRIPRHGNPVQSIFELIQAEQLTCDYMVAAGDLCNKANAVGLAFSWYAIKEIAQRFNAKDLLVTIGNHDVDSRHSAGQSDSFHLARYLADDFPFKDNSLNESYWSKGFAIVDKHDERFLIINSAVDHTDESSATRGTFNEARIDVLRTTLSNLEAKKGVAILHHHPILHSSIGMSADDILPTGDQLLKLCSEYEFNFVIHGHRHFPRLLKSPSVNSDQYVLGVGSFAQILQEMASTTRNLFHIVTLDRASKFTKGWVNTWEYNLRVGWMRATHTSASFPFHTGFGVVPADMASLAKEIYIACNFDKVSFVDGAEVLKLFPDLFYIQPNDLERLYELLVSSHKVKALFEQDGTFNGLARFK